MAIPFAMPRDEHPGMDLEQQLIRLLAIVSEIRMLLRLNTNNAREETAASRRTCARHGASNSRVPVITLSLDAGRVEMVVGAAPMGGTTVTTVTTTTTTTTTTSNTVNNRFGGDNLLPDANDHHHQQEGDMGDAAGPPSPGPDTAANAKSVAASLLEMAEKLQNLHLAVTEEIGDGCGVGTNDSGNDVPDSRPVNPATVNDVPSPEVGSAASDRSSSSSSRRSTVTTVTTFTTTRQLQQHPSASSSHSNTERHSVLRKLTVPSVSLMVVPFAVMVGWHWFKGR